MCRGRHDGSALSSICSAAASRRPSPASSATWRRCTAIAVAVSSSPSRFRLEHLYPAFVKMSIIHSSVHDLTQYIKTGAISYIKSPCFYVFNLLLDPIHAPHIHDPYAMPSSPIHMVSSPILPPRPLSMPPQQFEYSTSPQPQPGYFPPSVCIPSSHTVPHLIIPCLYLSVYL